MKKVIKNPIFTFILGILISGATVYAASYAAKDISFTPKDSAWKKSNGEDITNVKDAIDELYSKNNGKECVQGSMKKNANKNIELDFGIVPTTFLLTFNTDNTIWNIFYNKNVSDNFYISLNGLTNGYNSSSNKNNISVLSNTKYIYNAETTWTEYKNEYMISYIACK